MIDKMQAIFSVSGIRRIEERFMPEADPPLMERAGRAAAEEAFRLTMERPGRVLIVCGPGNNGGDGMVMARRLLQAKREVTLVFDGDPASLPTDAAKACSAWIEAGGSIVNDIPDTPPEGWALVADALFGIGLQRPLDGRFARWIEHLNALDAPRLAIDIPSGLDGDTGKVRGIAFRATHTLTFIALKPGLLTLDGPDHTGRLIVRNLDIDVTAFLPAAGHVVDTTIFHQHIRPRRHNSHKGDYGDAGIIGGASGMVGAGLLAGRAALRLGAGRIFVNLLDELAPRVDALTPEIMLRSTECVLNQASALAIGPGLGQSDPARAALAQALERPVPLVIDADALNLLAEDPALHQRCTHRRAPTLMTPHPGEAARLLATDTATIQSDRVQAAKTLSERYNALVVLKGAGSIIAMPDGRWFINATGHPGMASGGMGDVLCGLLTALLAQGWPADAALLAASHLHGAAADRLAREGIGPIGLTASEVSDAARGVFNGWLAQSSFRQWP